MKILILYNIATEVRKGKIGDLLCEKEIETILPLVVKSLVSRGHEVCSLMTDLMLGKSCASANMTLILFLTWRKVSEGEYQRGYSSRHIGSPWNSVHWRSTRNMLFTMDKEKTKLVLSNYGVPSSPHVLIRDMSDLNAFSLPFPVIVKPVREEASIGITYNSVVSDIEALHRQVRESLSLYHQPALVEQFIVGKRYRSEWLALGQICIFFLP